MIIPVAIAVGIVATMAATALRGSRLAKAPDTRGEIGAAEGWLWFWSFMGLAVGLVGLLAVFLSFRWNAEQIQACVEKDVLYADQAENLTEKFRAELLKYPEVEREIFESISPSNFSLYAVRYPELRSSEVLRDLADKVSGLWGRVYEVRREKIDREAAARFMRCWWRWL
jgi:hypothetical protein